MQDRPRVLRLQQVHQPHVALIPLVGGETPGVRRPEHHRPQVGAIALAGDLAATADVVEPIAVFGRAVLRERDLGSAGRWPEIEIALSLERHPFPVGRCQLRHLYGIHGIGTGAGVLHDVTGPEAVPSRGEADPALIVGPRELAEGELGYVVRRVGGLGERCREPMVIEGRAPRPRRRVRHEELMHLRAAIAEPEPVPRHPSGTHPIVDDQFARIPAQQLLGARIVGASALR